MKEKKSIYLMTAELKSLKVDKAKKMTFDKWKDTIAIYVDLQGNYYVYNKEWKNNDYSFEALSKNDIDLGTTIMIALFRNTHYYFPANKNNNIEYIKGKSYELFEKGIMSNINSLQEKLNQQIIENKDVRKLSFFPKFREIK